MTEREATLLIGLVTEYIRTGEPVGSVALARLLPLQRSAATVRADLHELEEAGYIFQPHVSAGRIPTDKGYRFFVDHVRARSVALAERQRLQQQFTQLKAAHQQLARITARFLAELTDMPALGAQHDPPEVFESGLRELVQDAPGTSLPELKELTGLLQQLDQRLTERAAPGTGELAAATGQANVYIGEEIPFMSAQHSSLVVRDVSLADGETLTLIIIGPKRMPYQRNVALLNAVADIIEQQQG